MTITAVDFTRNNPQTDAPAPLRAIDDRAPEARGFVLYVGLDETKAEHDGTDLRSLVRALRNLTAELAPSAEAHASIALAPAGCGGRDIDVTRLALGDPQARAQATPDIGDEPAGVVIDTSRKLALVDGENADLTYREFELLQYLVLREGKTVLRENLIADLWGDADDAPNSRTIDVHVRRLRAKLGSFESIVRTVRGQGYRFDRHADVRVITPAAPSFDRF